MPPLAVLLLAASALLVARRRRRARMPAEATIVSPRQSTRVARDGAVRSVQSAQLSVSNADLDRLWTPSNLENLARTYWRFLTKVTLGLIRVIYSEHDRRVVLLLKPLTLLRFGEPEYEFAGDRGTVRWRILDGLLVARQGCGGHGFLALEVRRETPQQTPGPATVHIQVEVANFHPAIATSFSIPVYRATQSFLHVLVTHAFLRSLASLDLAQSKVRRFPAPGQP